jgi:hypothetical protein
MNNARKATTNTKKTMKKPCESEEKQEKPSKN